MGVSVGSTIYNASSIYESGAGGGGGGGEGLPIGDVINFPFGYTPLESIEFTNRRSEGIKIPFSGYRANFNTTENNVEICLKMTNTDIDSLLIKYLPSSPLDELLYKSIFGIRYFLKYGNGQPASSLFYNISTDIIKEKFVLKDTYNKLSINSSVENIPGFTTINSKTDFIFGASPNSSELGPNAILYSIIIKDPAFNAFFIGVPAFDEANEIDGLLDIVTNEFFPHYWDS